MLVCRVIKKRKRLHWRVTTACQWARWIKCFLIGGTVVLILAFVQCSTFVCPCDVVYVVFNQARARKPFFQQGGVVTVKNQVLSCRLTSCNVVSDVKLERWPLFWHLSDISAICIFWPQFQILGGGGGSADPLNRPSRAPVFHVLKLLFYYTFIRRAHIKLQSQ